MERVWVVSYFEFDDKEATVSAFGDEDSAKGFYEYLKKTGRTHVAIDKVPVYNNFVVEWEKKYELR